MALNTSEMYSLQRNAIENAINRYREEWWHRNARIIHEGKGV
jgi:hypothetical protein